MPEYDKSRNKTPKQGLAVLSLVLLGLTMIPVVRLILQSWCLLMLLFGLGSAILVALGNIEDYLASRNYLEFESFKYACGLLVALLGYFARRIALDDVNHIFHIDPGPLSMTVWAGTALIVILALLTLFFFLAGIAAILVMARNSRAMARIGSKEPPSHIRHWECALMESAAWNKLVAEAAANTPPSGFRRMRIVANLRWIVVKRAWRKIRLRFPIIDLLWNRAKDRLAGSDQAIMAVAVMSWSLIGGIFAHLQLNETGRQQKLYMIALSTDFNSKFECDGINPFGKVALFIGPDQGKVLLAPEYEEVLDPSKPFLIGMKKPPDWFPILDCKPLPRDLKAWENDNHVKSEPPAVDAGTGKTKGARARIEPL